MTKDEEREADLVAETFERILVRTKQNTPPHCVGLAQQLAVDLTRIALERTKERRRPRGTAANSARGARA